MTISDGKTLLIRCEAIKRRDPSDSGAWTGGRGMLFTAQSVRMSKQVKENVMILLSVNSSYYNSIKRQRDVLPSPASPEARGDSETCELF
jgi:hypothetical protein